MEETTKVDAQAKMLDLAKELDKASVDPMRDVLKKIYDEKGIPFDSSHLEASRTAIDLCISHPSMSEVSRDFLIQIVLLHVRMIDDLTII